MEGIRRLPLQRALCCQGKQRERAASPGPDIQERSEKHQDDFQVPVSLPKHLHCLPLGTVQDLGAGKDSQPEPSNARVLTCDRSKVPEAVQKALAAR